MARMPFKIGKLFLLLNIFLLLNSVYLIVYDWLVIHVYSAKRNEEMTDILKCLVWII